MNAPEFERRFVCMDCKYEHTRWSPRCVGCSSLRGLVVVTSADIERLSSMQEAADPARVDQDLPREEKPRLSIARSSQSVSDDLDEDAVEECIPGSSDRVPVPISEIEETTFFRDSTGLPPLDHVLGGGLVPGSVVFLAAPPGTGKTSLTLQMLVGLRKRALYATGEETEAQVAGTARRIKAISNNLFVFAESNLNHIITHAESLDAYILVIDSLQKMFIPGVTGRAGSLSQLKECTAQLVKFAKKRNKVVWLIGHVTGEGEIAGPKTVEHDVDVVLELDRGPKFEGNERVLNCFSKNRFGPINVKGVFQITAEGLVAVDADGWDEEL